MTRPTVRRVKSTQGSEVHRLAADARDEVCHYGWMRLALNHDAFEVLMATRAYKLKLNPVHLGNCTDVQCQ